MSGADFRGGLRFAVAAAALLLACQAGLQLQLSRADSQTSDEGVHLSAGYSYWESRDLSLNPEHPPAVKLLAGAAVRLLHPVFPPVQHPDRVATFFYDSWRENRALGEAFLYESGNDADRLLFVGRLPSVLLTLILGVAIFAVAHAFFGPAGALLSTLLYVLDPTVAGHGHLITTDVAVSLGGVAVFAAAWRFAREPGPRSTMLLGLALGGASLAKFTSIIFLPTLAIVLLLLMGARNVVRALPRLIVAILVAWAVIWAGYGCSMQLPPPVASVVDAVAPDNQAGAGLKDAVGRVYEVVRHAGVPRQYFKGLALMAGHVAGGQESFLLGERSMRGWWYYFPVVFAAKTPVAVLALMILALVFTASRNEPRRWYWLVPAVSYFLCAMTSRADLGFRHLMPAMMFLCIWMGGLALELRTRRSVAAVTACLLIWLAIVFVRSYDRYLAYYNEVVGEKGYFVATDSNLDWGQDLKRIRAYLDRHPEIDAPYVVYTWDGPSSLDYYGIPRRPLPEAIAEHPGVLIISVSALPHPRFAFLRALPIADRITPGVFVYRLPGAP